MPTSAGGAIALRAGRQRCSGVTDGVVTCRQCGAGSVCGLAQRLGSDQSAHRGRVECHRGEPHAGRGWRFGRAAVATPPSWT